MKILTLYEHLKSRFGSLADPAAWWPIFHGHTTPPEFERAITAILVQKSTWKSVPAAVHSLAQQNLLTAVALASAPAERIAACIKTTGLQLQKAIRLKALCRFALERFGTENDFCKNVTREHLRSIAGIGDETADRILLYACSRLAWPVDDYCLRVFTHYGLLTILPTTPKEECSIMIKRAITDEMPTKLDDWQRLHALMQLNGELLPPLLFAKPDR